jgi:hypothetical protein
MAFRQLPAEDSEFKYDTCAVVGLCTSNAVHP